MLHSMEKILNRAAIQKMLWSCSVKLEMEKSGNFLFRKSEYQNRLLNKMESKSDSKTNYTLG